MSLSIEKQSLEAHVDLCAERYAGLKDDLAAMSNRIEKLEYDMAKRMDKVENGIEEIKKTLTAKENSALRSLVVIGVAVIASLLGTVGGLVWYVIVH